MMCGCIEFSIFFFLVKIDDENNNDDDEKNFRMESIYSIEKLRTLQEAI